LRHFVKEFEGGKLWARPYRFQILPKRADIVKYFLYTVLNPTSSGISKDPLAGGRPNALTVIRAGGKQRFRWFNRSAYENARRKSPKVSKERFYTYHTLEVSRLPGFKSKSDKSYLETIEALVERRRQEILEERRANKKGFLGKVKLLAQKAGVSPMNTKTSKRDSYNPIVLSGCARTRERRIGEYMALWNLFHEASERLRRGEIGVVFPKNCYRPPAFVSAQ
jgi:hypothetical protein